MAVRNPSESENPFDWQQLWEQCPAGCLLVDSGGNITAVNQAGRRLFDQPGRTLLHQRFSTLVVPDERKAVASLFGRTLETGGAEKREIRLETSRGRERVCIMELEAFEGPTGRNRVQAVLTDITERKQAEARLRQSEREKNAILDSLLEHVVYQDADMKVRWANQAACESVQMTREDLMGRYCHEVWANRDSPCEDCPVKRARDTGKRHSTDKMTPDGRWWHIQGFTVCDSNGQATGTTELTLDITDLKRAEKALREAKDDLEYRVVERTAELAEANRKLKQEIEDRKKSEAELRLKESHLRESEEFSSSLLANAPNPIIVFHPDSSIKYANPALEKLTGFSTAASTGKKMPYPWWLPEDMASTRREFEQALQKGLNRFEKCFQTQNGVPFWVEITFNKIESNGVLKYYLANWVDITERKQTEAALRNSEATARALLNAPGDVVVLLDNRGIVLEANAALGREFKTTPEALHGTSILDLFPPELARQRKVYLDRAVRSGTPVQFEDERDGKWWDSIVYPVKDDQGAVRRVAVVSRNVTQRKFADTLLKASEERYRAVVDNLAIGIALISPDMEILTLNHQMKQWFPHIDPKQRPLCFRSFFRHPREEVCDFCPTIQTLQGGGVHEAVIERTLGGKVRYYRLVASPVKDFQDKIVSSIMMVEDISERKWSEEQIQNLSQRLLHAQEVERQMLAAELHDSVAQDLSAIKIAVETLFPPQETLPPETRNQIKKLGAAITQSIATVRNLSYDLRPPGLTEIGLPQVLATYCDEFAKAQNLRMDFKATGFQDVRLDCFLEINLYRLVQEGLNNIRKHARAGRVRVKLIRSAPHIILRIEDDGKGFDVLAQATASGDEKHLGLPSMRDRVNLLAARRYKHHLGSAERDPNRNYGTLPGKLNRCAKTLPHRRSPPAVAGGPPGEPRTRLRDFPRRTVRNRPPAASKGKTPACR
jgi:PAS domain S-box-containing protein